MPEVLSVAVRTAHEPLVLGIPDEAGGLAPRRRRLDRHLRATRCGVTRKTRERCGLFRGVEEFFLPSSFPGGRTDKRPDSRTQKSEPSSSLAEGSL